ncbi:hypothetical protein DL96DRAFT_1715456 [Flagelloscypha sp. PMI_526]|nr:hypothetical protein DL96DRAFT_1715456 [Flagelloscypha sp. PMI_526]
MSATGNAQYDLDVSHWSNASSLPAACTVEPSSVEDVQTLFSIINATRTPWAEGDTCNNQNMSSTVGLQISMSQFTDFKVSPDRKSVAIGTGLIWADVYAALDKEELIVLGVAGLTLSSGYSFLTNQYGFAIDNVISIDVVLPNGTFVQVSQSSDAQLFAAFQGGVNNFGIVTQLTVNAFPIGEVYVRRHHTCYRPLGSLPSMLQTFYANTTTDPKANLAAVFNAVNGTAGVSFIVFYDGLFDPFLNLPNATVDLLKLTFEPNNRATWYSAPILSWPKQLIYFIVDEMTSQATSNPSFLKHTALIEARPGRTPLPNPFNTFNGLFVWDDPADDEVIVAMTVEYHNAIWKKAIELGVSRKKAYFPPNYSQRDTPVEQIYGTNLHWLRRVQKRVDPWDITALTGGFKI